MPQNIIPVGINLVGDADLERQTGRQSRCECVGGALAGTIGIVVGADYEPLRSVRGLECRELAGGEARPHRKAEQQLSCQGRLDTLCDAEAVNSVSSRPLRKFFLT